MAITVTVIAVVVQVVDGGILVVVTVTVTAAVVVQVSQAQLNQLNRPKRLTMTKTPKLLLILNTTRPNPLMKLMVCLESPLSQQKVAKILALSHH